MIDLQKIKEKYGDYNFDKQHKLDKIFMGIVIHFDKETGDYIKPPFWEELRTEWKALTQKEYGYEPCGEFDSGTGTACQNHVERLEENNGVCLMHSAKKQMRKIPESSIGHIYKMSAQSIQTCDSCMLPYKEETCPYYKENAICTYEYDMYKDVVDKLKQQLGDNVTPILEIKIQQLAINVVLNMRASLLLSKNMYVRDSRSTLEIHPAFKVFKDTTNKIDAYINSIDKIINETQTSDTDNPYKQAIEQMQLQSDSTKIDLSDIEKNVQKDLKNKMDAALLKKDVKQWNELDDFFEEEDK